MFCCLSTPFQGPVQLLTSQLSQRRSLEGRGPSRLNSFCPLSSTGTQDIKLSKASLVFCSLEFRTHEAGLDLVILFKKYVLES